MIPSIEDVLEGEEIVNYYRMDIPDDEAYYKTSVQQVRLIRKGARMMPDHLTREEAEESLFRAGRDYSREWLDANESKLDPYDLFWLTVEAYSIAPYGSIPKRRMMNLKKIRPSDYLKNLDPELPDSDPITVYRGCSEFSGNQRSQLSWTTDPETAIFFYNRKKMVFDCITGGEGVNSENIEEVCQCRVFYPALWKATISRDRIIATDNGRSECEILQHCGVKNIQEVPISEDQVQAALDARKARIKANDDLILNYE